MPYFFIFYYLIKMKEEIIHFEHNGKYPCNENIKPKKEKMSKDWKEVTCKNCKKVNFYY